MDFQTVINTLLGLVTFFVGIWVRGLSDSMKELKDTDSHLADKVQKIEILVVGGYIRRDEIEKMIGTLFQKLDKIESKLYGKADK